MKMPGFTAEASLYEPKGHYRMAGTGGSTALVLPQCSSSSRCWSCRKVGQRCQCTATGAPNCVNFFEMDATNMDVDLQPWEV
jgi:hypothetical protein